MPVSGGSDLKIGGVGASSVSQGPQGLALAPPRSAQRAVGDHPRTRTRVKTPFKQWVGEETAGGKGRGEQLQWKQLHLLLKKRQRGTLGEGSSNYW